MYNGPPVAPEDIWSVYVVMNGSLGMSPGKMAAQAFHTGYLVGCTVSQQYDLPEHYRDFEEWAKQGRRVRVRIAETPHVFDRVCNECIGASQQDEGLTEVERGSITAFVSVPYLPADTPKILSHKKVQSL